MTDTYDLSKLPPGPGILDLPDPDTLPPAAPQTAAGVFAAPASPRPAVQTPPQPVRAPEDVYEPEDTVAARSDLEQLAADVAVALDTLVELPIPGRSGYTVKFNIDITEDELKHWRRISKGRKEVDGQKVSRLIIANKAVEILRAGRVLRDSVGEPLNFRHRELHDLLGVRQAVDAVKALYALDGSIDSVSTVVLEHAGWGDSVDAVASPDPYVRRLTKWMQADGRVRDAAAIGDLFGLDPVLVLAEPDPIRKAARIAAANHVIDARNQRNNRR